MARLYMKFVSLRSMFIFIFWFLAAYVTPWINLALMINLLLEVAGWSFMDFSPYKKGWKVFDLEAHKRFLSWDVRFESICFCPCTTSCSFSTSFNRARCGHTFLHNSQLGILSPLFCTISQAWLLCPFSNVAIYWDGQSHIIKQSHVIMISHLLVYAQLWTLSRASYAISSGVCLKYNMCYRKKRLLNVVLGYTGEIVMSTFL